MHQEGHEVFQAPADIDTPIWRYMDLAKLVSLLTSSTLWFSRADLLGDPHEGSTGSATQRMREQYDLEMARQREANPDATPLPDDHQPFNVQMQSFLARWVKVNGVNCWYKDETESVAMWRGYAGLTTGVAVRSTYQRLCESIIGEQDVYIGTVRYIDPDTELVPMGNVYYPLMHKRKAFAYENELRAVTQLSEDPWSSEPAAPGIAVSIDIGKLIDAVVVGPDQGGWFYESVARVVSAFAPHVPVQRSYLDTDPIF